MTNRVRGDPLARNALRNLARLGCAALLAICAMQAPAIAVSGADSAGPGGHGNGHAGSGHGGGGHRSSRHDGGLRGGRGGYGGWGGGFYPGPPVVYGAPYYCAPPLVYMPGHRYYYCQ